MGVVALLHLVAACVIGLALPHLADLPQAVRTSDGVVTGEVQLGKTFNDDGWLIVLGGAAGLVLGLLLVVWRRSHEVVTVVATVVCALAAAWLAGYLAWVTGPGDATSALTEARVGATAPLPVTIDSRAAYLVWPLCATLSALVGLLAPPSGATDERTGVADISGD